MTRGPCEARAMDKAAVREDLEPIPECYEPGVVERSGFVLCAECAQAFDAIMPLAVRVVREKREES